MDEVASVDVVPPLVTLPFTVHPSTVSAPTAAFVVAPSSPTF